MNLEVKRRKLVRAVLVALVVGWAVALFCLVLRIIPSALAPLRERGSEVTVLPVSRVGYIYLAEKRYKLDLWVVLKFLEK